MVNFGNPKNAIWEAFLITIIIFAIGLLLGVAYEQGQVSKIDSYYVQSEISLMDSIALQNLIDLDSLDCQILIDANVDFADKIYEEAVLIDRLEESGKLKDNLWLAHKKYDALRTFLWINTIKTIETCSEDLSLVVYLYEYNVGDLHQKAKQSVWSKILSDLKKEKGNEVVLIPIAADSELISLDSLISKFNITEYPAVIVNQEFVLNEINSVEDFNQYFK